MKRGGGAAEGKSRGWMDEWMDGRWKRERRELGKWREKRSGDSGQNKVKGLRGLGLQSAQGAS